MTTEQTKGKRRQLSVAEKIQKQKEQHEKTIASILRSVLNEDAVFAKIKDSRLKTKKYLSEVNSLLTVDGFNEAEQRLDERIAALEKERDLLLEKRNVGAAAKNDLEAKLSAHESVQAQLAAKLTAIIKDGNIETAPQDISSALAKMDLTNVLEVVDPFAAYRRKRDNAEATETNNEQE